MKLRSLLFGMMAAVAFTACSDKEDIPNPGGEEPVAGTYLNIKTDFMGVKADDAITDLTVIVADYTTGDINTVANAEFGTWTWDPAKNFVKPDGADGGASLVLNELENIKVPAGRQRMVVIANAGELLFTGAGTEADPIKPASTLTNLSVVYAMQDNNPDRMVMSSKEYDIMITTNAHNYVGYPQGAKPEKGEGRYMEVGKPVILYRNVAKINLVSIKLGQKFQENCGEQFPNPTLDITNAFVIQGRANSLIANPLEWGKTEAILNDDVEEPAEMYKNGLVWREYETQFKAQLLKDELFAKAPLLSYENYENYWQELVADLMNYTIYIPAPVDQEITFVKDWAATDGVFDTPFYVYENLNTTAGKDGEILTLLVLKGDLSYFTPKVDEKGDPVWIDKDKDGEPDLFDNPEFGSVAGAPEKIWMQDKDLAVYNNRYFPIAVGVTGLEDGYNVANVYTPSGQTINYNALGAANRVSAGYGTNFKGILRNLQYNVSVTINSPGYDTAWGGDEDDRYPLDVLVEVAPWGIVNQAAPVN